MTARLAMAVGPAVESPVVEDGELAVRGGVDIEFHHLGAKVERGLHRGQGIFDLRRDRQANSGRGTGVVGDPV